MQYLFFETLDSTNLFLKEHFKEYDDSTLVTCENQLQGRGRLGRSWDSNKDNLKFSILIKNINKPISDYPFIMGATLYEVFKAEGIDSYIKWPNDLIINNKKVAGILCESVSNNEKINCLIIGVGINVNQLDFNDLNYKATSLFKETNIKYDLKKLLDKIAIKFEENLNKDSYKKINQEHSYVLNKVVKFTYKNENKEGKVLAINDDFSLKIVSENKEYNVISNEVSLSLNYQKEN